MRYEYKCLKCDKVFEKDVKLVDYKKKQPCPECKKLAERFIKSVYPKSQTWQV